MPRIRRDSDGFAKVIEGSRSDFRRRVRARWMIEEVVYGNVMKKTSRPYAFFTCPWCGGINKAFVSNTFAYETEGEFDCIYCDHCSRNMSIRLIGFGEAWEKAKETGS